jgi:NAD(P)-dependent dehydrogenase (short-subunit alcohol dehydrogenase family)
MAQSTLAAFGRIDGVFANAGVTGEGTVENTPLDDWNKVIAINLTGVYLTCQAVLPAMIAQRNGAIVATASVAGIAGVPSTASYSAAKAGVVGLVRQMSADFAQYNIRANAICPGTVPTPLVVSAYEQRGFKITNEASWKMHLEVAVELVRLVKIGGYVCFDDTHLENKIWIGKGKLAIPMLLDTGFIITHTDNNNCLILKKYK